MAIFDDEGLTMTFNFMDNIIRGFIECKKEREKRMKEIENRESSVTLSTTEIRETRLVNNRWV